MIINNQEDVKLPLSMERALENAKNTLTVTEQETKRLIALARDQENSIRSLLDKKAGIESELTKEESRLSDLKSQVDSLRSEMDEKRAQLDAMAIELQQGNSYLTNLNSLKDQVMSILSSLK